MLDSCRFVRFLTVPLLAILILATLIADSLSAEPTRGFFDRDRGIFIPSPEFNFVDEAKNEGAAILFSCSLRKGGTDVASVALSLAKAQSIDEVARERPLEGFTLQSFGKNRGAVFTRKLSLPDGVLVEMMAIVENVPLAGGKACNLVFICTSPLKDYERYVELYETMIRAIEIGDSTLPKEGSYFRDDRYSVQFRVPDFQITDKENDEIIIEMAFGDIGQANAGFVLKKGAPTFDEISKDFREAGKGWKSRGRTEISREYDLDEAHVTVFERCLFGPEYVVKGLGVAERGSKYSSATAAWINGAELQSNRTANGSPQEVGARSGVAAESHPSADESRKRDGTVSAKSDAIWKSLKGDWGYPADAKARSTSGKMAVLGVHSMKGDNSDGVCLLTVGRVEMTFGFFGFGAGDNIEVKTEILSSDMRTEILADQIEFRSIEEGKAGMKLSECPFDLHIIKPLDVDENTQRITVRFKFKGTPRVLWLEDGAVLELAREREDGRKAP